MPHSPYLRNCLRFCCLSLFSNAEKEQTGATARRFLRRNRTEPIAIPGGGPFRTPEWVEALLHTAPHVRHGADSQRRVLPSGRDSTQPHTGTATANGSNPTPVVTLSVEGGDVGLGTVFLPYAVSYDSTATHGKVLVSVSAAGIGECPANMQAQYYLNALIVAKLPDSPAARLTP